MAVFRRRTEPVPAWGADGTTRIAVTVTFLRQEQRPQTPARPLPDDTALVRVPNPTVAFYRYLYGTVGAPYVWWLRRTLPDAEIAAIIGAPGVSIHVLTRGHEPAGFFEIDARRPQTVNLSYFGLMPHAVGQGLGMPLLRASLTVAWAHAPRAVTVNTCTADHPRALPNYLECGFTPVRTAREIWDVPDRLGLTIPERLKV